MAAGIQKSGFVNGRRIPVISPALTLTVFADRREKEGHKKLVCPQKYSAMSCYLTGRSRFLPGTFIFMPLPARRRKKQLQIIPQYAILAAVNDHENEKIACRSVGLQRYGDGRLLLCR